MIEKIEVFFRCHIDHTLRPASIYVIIRSERLNLSGQKTITLPAGGNLLFFPRLIPRLMSVDSVSLIIKRASARVWDSESCLHGTSSFSCFSFLAIPLSFHADCCLELIDRPVVLYIRPLYGCRCQFGVVHGIEVHNFIE